MLHPTCHYYYFLTEITLRMLRFCHNPDAVVLSKMANWRHTVSCRVSGHRNVDVRVVREMGDSNCVTNDRYSGQRRNPRNLKNTIFVYSRNTSRWIEFRNGC